MFDVPSFLAVVSFALFTACVVFLWFQEERDSQQQHESYLRGVKYAMGRLMAKHGSVDSCSSALLREATLWSNSTDDYEDGILAACDVWDAAMACPKVKVATAYKAAL